VTGKLKALLITAPPADRVPSAAYAESKLDPKPFAMC
jgi:hypothetical protein